ncbi:FGGY-family carbohydrate kinase [Pseudolysinimonas yzui]|uniref:Xylulokinase n=1 Tax=Pseudolysinimonas yzui TaxID=2708254 RepID=A0A8J3GSG1_9MICO|nr:FGGY-family carbohydrate kinase [Pseudolysinimonas yzui]GHF22930.1 xylulokinase [Pseudolysinimonas yzui]
MSLLGIDLGTSGVRAACYDRQGRMLATTSLPTSLVHGRDGIVTTDAEAVATAAESAIRQVIAHPAVLNDPVEAVSFSVQGEAVVPIDREGRALARSPVSMDRRGMQAASDLGDRLGRERVQVITGQPLHPMFSVYKIAAGGPGWSGDEVAGYRCLDGFLAERLGAGPVIDYSMAARTGAFDVTTRTWSEEIIAAVAGRAPWLTMASLPNPVPAGSPIGAISATAAERTGLAVGTVIVAGVHDQAASFLGAGGRAGDSSVFALGTSDCLTVATVARPAGLETTGFASYPLTDELWVTLAGTAAGGWALEWFADLVDQPLEQLFAHPSETPPRLLVLPYFTGSGTLDNDTEARGVIAGLTLTTDHPQLARAFLEATGFELAKILAAFAAAGIPVGAVRAVGSGAANRIALDIRADAAGIDLSPVSGSAAARGAALIAGVGLGVYSGLTALPAVPDADQMTASAPDPRHRAWYDRQRAAFRELYLTLRPLHQSLSHNEETSP